MSILPKNSSIESQRFVELLDSQVQVSYADITSDPMKCDASLLPHIALAKGANIDGMVESEARLYLSTYSRKLIGTVGAVEDAVNAVWSDAKIIEWMDDKTLQVGEFNVDVSLKPDVSIVYNDRLFSLSKRLIKKSKNVRSQLKSFNIHLPLITAEILVSSGCCPLKVSPLVNINELIISDSVSLKSGWVFNSSLDTKINESLSIEDINLTGGYEWQVEV